MAASAIFAVSAALFPASSGAAEKKIRVLLVGASVGKSWELAGLSKRLNDGSFEFEAVQAWQFDKTEALDEVLLRPKRKLKLNKAYIKGFLEPPPLPADVIIIKECAAYFPGDLSRYKPLVKKWVGDIKAAGKRAALATVVPVTAKHAKGKPGRIEAIREFNDWLREFAATEKLPLVDLEAEVRTNSKERFLRDEYTSGDGLHLNKQAYDAMDRLLLDFARKNFHD